MRLCRSSLLLLFALGCNTIRSDKDPEDLDVRNTLRQNGWEPMQAGRWQEWTIPMYAEAVRVTSRFNRHGVDSCSDWHSEPPDGYFDFPVFVMNLRSRSDRRQHTQCLLRSLGFTNVSFPTSTLASELNVEHAVQEGLISETLIHNLSSTLDFGEKAALAYAANAIDMMRYLYLELQ